MNRKTLPIPDEELVAFVDRRLPEAQRQLIAARAGKDSALAARIALLTDGSPALEAAFQPDLTNIPLQLIAEVKALSDSRRGASGEASSIAPLPLREQFGMQPSRRHWLVMGSAMAASFAAGIVGGPLLVGKGGNEPGSMGKPAENDWREAVAQYHALYGKRTIERLNPTLHEKDDELALVSEALGHPLSGIERLASGYTYKRAQLLEFEAAPLVQIVFEAPDKVPLAYCLKRSRGIVRSTNPEVETRLGMALASWNHDGIDQLVVARISEASILNLASRLKERG